MPIFTAFTHLHRRGGSVEFAPGDTVPDWAIGEVTNRVHDGGSTESNDAQAAAEAKAEADAKAAADAQAAAAEKAAADAKATADAKAEADAQAAAKSEQEATPEETGEPDFTKPAPAKRGPGRPRKKD